MVTGTYTPDRYNTNGAQTEFDITFEFKSEDHIHVWVRNKTTNTESELSNPTDFSVSGAKIVTVDTWPAGYELIIKLILEPNQNTDYIRNDNLPSEKVEIDFDKVVRMIRQIKETLSRIPQLKQSSEHSDIELDDPEDGYSLVWDGGKLKNARQFGSGSYVIQVFMETFFESSDIADAQGNLGIADFVKTLLNDADADAFLTTLGFTAFVRTLIDDANAGDFLTTLGFSAYIKTLINDADAATARATLGALQDAINAIKSSHIDWGSGADQIDLDEVPDGATYKRPLGVVTADTAWHEVGAGGEPAFENSWVNYGGALATCAFRKDALNFVHLKGTVKNGTIGSGMFTLPAGDRPQDTRAYAVVSIGALGRIYVTNAGAVYCNIGSSGYVQLDGITFYAG